MTLPHPPYQLRPVTPADIPGLLALMREMAEFEGLTDIFRATHTSLADSLCSANPAAHCLVGHAAGAPDTLVAYAIWFHNYSSFLDRRGLYLEDLYVQPAHRRRGIGRQFLKELARIALEEECGRFEWVVLDWNQGAIDFYRHQGAEVLEEWRIVRVTGDALRRLAI